MKKAITLTLIAILFLGLFAGCNTYTRPVVHGTDGGRVTRGFQYRHDGYVTDGGTTRNASVNDGVRNGLYDGNMHQNGVAGLDGTSHSRGLATHSGARHHGTTHGHVHGHHGHGTARHHAVDGVARSTAR